MENVRAGIFLAMCCTLTDVFKRETKNDKKGQEGQMRYEFGHISQQLADDRRARPVSKRGY